MLSGPRGSGVGQRSAPAEALRLAIVLVASIPAIQPLLNRGLQDGTYDATYHLARLLDFDRTFRAGELLPWIAPHLALDYGYGYATFTFYAPLGLYLGEAFRVLGLGYIASLKASFAVAVLASAVGAYLLARDLFGWRAAMASAVAYVYVPYRLLDVYVGGDLAEAVAQAALPFAFWGIWRVTRKPGAGSSAVAGVALGALILAHNITALFAAPLLLGFLVISTVRQASRATVVWLAVAGILGLALSGVYWLPVLAQLGEVNTVALTAGQFDFHREFLPLNQLVQHRWTYDYRLLPRAGAMYNLGLAQFVLTIFAVLWVALVRPNRLALLLFAAVGTFLLLWMQQSGSVAVWDHLPLARFIQYQTRLSSYIGLLSALLLGSFAADRGERALRIARSAIGPGPVGVVGTCLAVAAVFLLADASLARLPRQSAPLRESEVNLPTIWSEESQSRLIVGNTQGDYLPASVRATFFQNAAAAVDTVPASVSARLTALWSGPLTFDARSDAARPATILLDRLAYPGWRATIDGKSVPIGTALPRGIIQVTVPAGQHELRITDPGTDVDQLGALSSCGALIVVLAIVVRPGQRDWRRRLIVVALVAGLAVAEVAGQVKPPRQLAGGIDFGDSVRLVGSRADRVPGSQPGAVDVTLIWEALRAPLPDCTVHLELRDASGRVVARRDKAPLFGQRPCSSWEAGEIVRDNQQIRLPPGATAGRYGLDLGLTLGGTAAVPGPDPVPLAGVRPAATILDDSRFAPLGLVDASAAPSPATLPGAFPVGATIGDAFSLDAARVEPLAANGPSLPRSSDPRYLARIAPGDGLQVHLLWRSVFDAPADDAVFVHLIDARQQLVAQRDNYPDHENFPTSVWFPTDTLVDDYRLETPANLPPGVYTIGVGMYARHDLKTLPVRGNRANGYQVILGRVKATNRDQVFGRPLEVSPLDATFGRRIALVGASVQPSAPGAPIVVNLEWRALAAPSADYTVFVHLLDARGRLVAQHDGPPLAGTYPTTDWD
ncbi:MAG: 6-pyruvoyl-tetrahydropterin synthase-related protein, partial [Chloroflexota bacterium]